MESRTLRSHRVVGAIADDAPTCVSFYDLGGVGFVCARVAGDDDKHPRLQGTMVGNTYAGRQNLL